VSEPVPGQTLTPVASPAGAAVARAPVVAEVIGAPAAQANVSLRVTAAAVAANTPVTVTSSDDSIARVVNAPVVVAGQQIAALTIATGNAGVATLTVRAGSEVRTVLVIVGHATSDETLAALAAPAGVSIAAPQSSGQVFAAAGTRHTIAIRLLSAPAAADTPINATSSNPAIAAIDGAVVVHAGSQVATITIVTGASGVADLFFATSGGGVDLTVASGVGGTPPPIVTSPLGVAVSSPPSAGRLIAPAAGQQTVGVRVLASAAAADTPVIVTSTNPAVASAIAATTVPAGQQLSQITIATGAPGVATLTVTAGSEIRELTIIVGGANNGQVPATVASPVGVAVQQAPLAGVVISPVGAVAAVGVRLLGQPAVADVPVSVTTSNPGVANVQGTVVIPAGGQVAIVSIGTGAQGVAELTITAGTQTIRLTVIAGTPPDGVIPIIAAPIVGVQIQKP